MEIKWLIGVGGRENKENGREGAVKEIMPMTFPEIILNYKKPQIHETSCVSSKINTNKSVPRSITYYVTAKHQR